MPDRNWPLRADRFLPRAADCRLGAVIGACTVAVLSCLALPGLAQMAAGNPETGLATAMAICSNCHLVSSAQTKPASDGVPTFDELARDPAVTEARLRGFLHHPHPAMPDPQLSRQEMDNIVSYILARRAVLR